jgi:uncharacterized oligopeptide transporter (OPT) family protein
MLNMASGLVVLGASEQSADILSNLKTTYLFRISPHAQFYAQICGALFSIFMTVGMYFLFSAAYLCINDPSLAVHCSFCVPGVGAWRITAAVVTEPTLPIPPSSGYTFISFGILVTLITIVKYRFVPTDKYIPKQERYHYRLHP